jgi:hypothetical protein
MTTFYLGKGAAAFPFESPSGFLPRGHVVFHHGAFLPLVPNVICVIGIGCLKKLLKVISGLPHLAHEIALSSGDELLIGVTNILIVVTLIAAGRDRDLLGSPLQPLLSLFVPLFVPLSVVLGEPLDRR